MKHFALLFVCCCAISACGKSLKEKCEDICDKTRDCDASATSAQKDGSVATCKGTCAYEDALADKAECTSQADTLVDCTNKGDVCTVTDRCSGELNGFGSCVLPYCQAHQDDTDCQALIATYAN